MDDNFFEDESLGSNSSDDDDDDIGTPEAAEELYQRYFGSQAWKGGSSHEISGASASLSQSRVPDSPSSPTRIKKVRPFLGPTSDMLAPVVSLTRQFDREILSYQSIAIAEGWELGPWDTFTNDEDADPYAVAMRLEESKIDTPDAFSQKGQPHLQSSYGGIVLFSHSLLPFLLCTTFRPPKLPVSLECNKWNISWIFIHCSNQVGWESREKVSTKL